MGRCAAPGSGGKGRAMGEHHALPAGSAVEGCSRTRFGSDLSALGGFDPDCAVPDSGALPTGVWLGCGLESNGSDVGSARSGNAGDFLVRRTLPLRIYRDLGLDITPANHSVEAGLQLVWEMMVAGKLKVFESLGNWWKEFRKYSRDDKGNIVKADDHLMDAMRYLMMSGRDRMKARPAERRRVE